MDEVALGLHNSLEEVVAEVELHGLLCVRQEQIHCVLAVCDLKYINDNILEISCAQLILRIVLVAIAAAFHLFANALFIIA